MSSTRSISMLLFLSIVLLACPKVEEQPIDSKGIPPHVTLGFPGPLDFERHFYTVDDEFHVTVFRPVSDEPIADAPLIVFNVGWNAIRTTYESYCIQFAQWGYVCVIRYYPSLGIVGLGDDLFDKHVAHCLRTIDWAAKQNADPDSPIFGMVDMNNVGLIGHSLGGSVTLVAMWQDPRVKTAISIDGLLDNSRGNRMFNFEAVDFPVLYVGGTAISLCGQPPGSDRDLYAETPRPKQRILILGADHMDFMEAAPNSPDSQDVGDLFCQTGTVPAVEVRVMTHRYVIPWFNYHLKGQTEFLDYFAGSVAFGDAAAGKVEIDISL